MWFFLVKAIENVNIEICSNSGRAINNEVQMAFAELCSADIFGGWPFQTCNYMSFSTSFSWCVTCPVWHLHPLLIHPLLIHPLLIHPLSCSPCMLSDVTRVLLLDETQGRNFAEMMPSLLKSLGRKLASENYSVSSWIWLSHSYKEMRVREKAEGEDKRKKGRVREKRRWHGRDGSSLSKWPIFEVFSA